RPRGAPEGEGRPKGAGGPGVDHDRESELRLVRVGALPPRLQADRGREAPSQARRPRRLAGPMRETPTAMTNASPTALLLNVGHALDHLFLLIFATAVSAIAAEWGMIWQDLMPYTVGAFVLFGLGAWPAGRLGDLWGRRAMMVVFFLGMGLSGLAIAAVPGVWSLAVALTVMGAFSSIYHPVGIPMLVQSVKNPGFTIGLNG